MKKFALMIVLMLCVGLVPLTAQDEEMPDFIQHSECENDLTGQTVTIFHLGDISSAGYSPITLPLVAGVADAIAYFNERGGVCGAELAQENRDTGGDPGQTQAGYDFFSGEDVDMLILYSSADSELLRPQVAEDEIPVIISAGSVEGLYGENGDEPGWIYATNPLYADQLGSFCDYVAANPDEFPENPTIGYMGWGGAVAAFGLSAFTPETRAYCESVGVPILENAESFEATATDVSTQVDNLVFEGANIIYTNALASGPVRVAEAVDFLGYGDEVVLAAVNWGMDSSVPLLARNSIGEDGLPVVNGMYGSLPFNWYTETDLPGIQLLLEQAALNERGPDVTNISYLLGWTLVDYYIELYTQATNEVGSVDAVDGPLMRQIIESTVYSPLDLYTVDFQEGAIRALPLNRIVQMRFANATMDGIATSGDDALAVDFPDGTTYYPPVIVPLTDFLPAPDLRPGQVETSE